MGRQKDKNQVVFYLPPELHRALRMEAARTGTSMSALVEDALRTRMRVGGNRKPLPGDPEAGWPEVAEALAEYGAPLWSSGRSTHLTLEQALAAGVEAARHHPSLLRALPVVLWKNRERLSFKQLCGQVGESGLPVLGMVLDLTAEVTGSEQFRRWARELFRKGPKRKKPVMFFLSGPRGHRYLELSRLRTPDVVRRWGFLMATPLDDFKTAVRRFCTDLESSTGRT